MKEIRISKPSIFPEDEIIAGITHKNSDLFPPQGISISRGNILSDEEVERHRTIMARSLATKRGRMKFQRQVHNNHIRLIYSQSHEEESDGMATSERGVVLNLTLADCCGILIYDPVNKAVAALHSGWRGAKLNIASRGIQKMNEWFSSRPENLLAWLSPCASVDNYEVGEKVAIHFPGFIQPKDNGKYLLDIPAAVKNQLSNEGVSEGNIELSGICTIADERFHSYRRDKDRSGRMSAFIGLR